MPVTQQPAKFISHAVEFDTEEDAKRHDQLVEAKEDLKRTEHRFSFLQPIGHYGSSVRRATSPADAGRRRY